jgi:DNA-binding transcriptional LysR family regulator
LNRLLHRFFSKAAKLRPCCFAADLLLPVEMQLHMFYAQICNNGVVKLKNLDELQTFVQVVDSGNLTTAGHALGLSTTLVSRQLARLEERLGVTLATRTTRRFALTEEGQRLYEYAQRILREAEAAERAVTQRSPFDGELSFIVQSILAEELRSALYETLAAHPRLKIQMIVTDEPASVGVRTMTERGLDAVIVVGEVPERAVIARRITTIDGVLAASKEYVKTHRLPQSVRDLEDHSCLCYVGEAPIREWALTRGTEEPERVLVDGSFASSSSQELIAALIAGQGIGVVMKRRVQELDLVPVLPDYRFGEFPISLVYGERRRGSPRINILEELVRNALSSEASAASSLRTPR